MAVQDNPKFKEWERATAELQKREAFYKSAKEFPKSHPLRKHCEKKLKEAQDAYDTIVKEL